MTDAARYIPKNRYEADSRARYVASLARLRLWNAAMLVLGKTIAADDTDELAELRSVVKDQADAATRDRENAAYYEASVSQIIARDEQLVRDTAARTAKIAEPIGDRCLAEVSDHDSRWPRYHQCTNRSKGRVDLKDYGLTDLCGTHVRRWAKGKSVWPHKEGR